MTDRTPTETAADNRIAIAELGAIAGYAVHHTPEQTLDRLRARMRQLLAANCGPRREGDAL